MTFLGRAVILVGMAKTIKAVAPMDAMITACSMLRSRSTINVVIVASKL